MSIRLYLILPVVGMLALGACVSQRSAVELAANAHGLPILHEVDPDSLSRIRGEVLDRVNFLRTSAGARTLQLNAELTAAATAHARDMAMQNQVSHIGSDRSSPIERARHAGYRGVVLGENLVASHGTERETVAALMSRPDTRDVLTDPRARDLGITFVQDASGKIWWTFLVGDGAERPQG